jgi:hypothetical protein
MLSNCFTIISKINNIISNNNNKSVNTTFLSCPFYKKHFNNYIALSNQKSFEIYSKYNTNTFPKFSVLDKNQNINQNMKQNMNQNIKQNINKYIKPSYIFIGCFYIFLAYFAKNTSFIV